MKAAPFSVGQDVAIVEHDDRTRLPRTGGDVYPASVSLITDGGAYVQVRTENGTLLTFWAESGWHAPRETIHSRDTWSGEFRWRLAPLCYRCDEPITGTPVRIPGDIPANRSWCTEDCREESAEISASR